MSQSIVDDESNQVKSYSFPSQRTLEDRLQGLSESDLLVLRELLTTRLEDISSPSKNVPLNYPEALNLGQLTNREKEVLTLVASGYTRPEVAKALTISRNTAATHVANIYRKLDIESIAEATMLAVRGGIVS